MFSCLSSTGAASESDCAVCSCFRCMQKAPVTSRKPCVCCCDLMHQRRHGTQPPATSSPLLLRMQPGCGWMWTSKIIIIPLWYFWIIKSNWIPLMLFVVFIQLWIKKRNDIIIAYKRLLKREFSLILTWTLFKPRARYFEKHLYFVKGQTFKLIFNATWQKTTLSGDFASWGSPQFTINKGRKHSHTRKSGE